MHVLIHLHSKLCKNSTIYLKIVYVVEVKYIFSLKLPSFMFFRGAYQVFKFSLFWIWILSLDIHFMKWCKIIFFSHSMFHVAVIIVWWLDWEFCILFSIYHGKYQLKKKKNSNLNFYHIKSIYCFYYHSHHHCYQMLIVKWVLKRNFVKRIF